MSQTRANPAAVATRDKLFVILGNGGGGTVEYFDGATRTVEFLRDSSSGNPVQFWGDPANAEATQACAALVSEEEAVVAGHQVGGQTSREAYSLNLVTGSWSKLPDMLARRHHFACGVVDFQGSSVFMALGGSFKNAANQNEDQLSFETLDMRTRSGWNMVNSTPSDLPYNLGGRLFNSGGRGGRVSVLRYDRVYFLDESTMAWGWNLLEDPSDVGLQTSMGALADAMYFKGCK